MKYLHANDVHLEMIDDNRFDLFTAEIRSHNADALWLCGDIAIAGSLENILKRLADAIEIPIYFVLGNHDYYYGSIQQVRDKVVGFTQGNDLLHWIPDCGPVTIADGVSLIGHGGWGDARFGDFDESTFKMNDYICINELSMITHVERKKRLQDLGTEAANSIRTQLSEALKTSKTVYILTHVPPFQQAAFHEGKPSDDNAAPHFSCKATGEAIVEIMAQFPDKQTIVLCGHTHGQGTYKPLDNVTVINSAAEYRDPRVAGVINI